MPNSLLRSIQGLAAALLLLMPSALLAKEGVLIIGGAGNTGSAVAKLLVERGDHVTVFVRTTTDRSRLEGLSVEYVVGDAMKADEVAAALQGKHFSVMFETIQVYPGLLKRVRAFSIASRDAQPSM
jgi:uncharacterized protein YbjT (DUF2867 family)